LIIEIFKKYKCQYLSYYWSFNGNYNDQIGGANLVTANSVNYGLTNDRFGSPNSALNLTSGYMTLPPATYFQGAFTFIAWINIKQSIKYQRIIDIGNVNANDVVLMCITSSLYVGLSFNEGNLYYPLESNVSLSLLNWYHVAYTVDSLGFATIYLNGKSIYSGQQKVTNSVIRTNGFIGKSSNNADPNANSIYDELRIYNGSLSSNFIYNDYLISKDPSTSTTSTTSKLSSSTTTTSTSSTTSYPSTTTTSISLTFSTTSTPLTKPAKSALNAAAVSPPKAN
jgi:hypothetical protein